MQKVQTWMHELRRERLNHTNETCRICGRKAGFYIAWLSDAPLVLSIMDKYCHAGLTHCYSTVTAFSLTQSQMGIEWLSTKPSRQKGMALMPKLGIGPFAGASASPLANSCAATTSFAIKIQHAL